MDRTLTEEQLRQVEGALATCQATLANVMLFLTSVQPAAPAAPQAPAGPPAQPVEATSEPV
jgi:hypothetical protein